MHLDGNRCGHPGGCRRPGDLQQQHRRGHGYRRRAYAGDSNHLGATGSTTFTIEKAPVVVTLTCPASADCTATATASGPGLATTVPVTHTSNTYPGTATATFAGDTHHLSGTATATFKVIGFTLKGYYPPVRTFDTATFWNVARARHLWRRRHQLRHPQRTVHREVEDRQRRHGLLPRHHHRRPLPADRLLHPAVTHDEGSTSGNESPESTTKRPQTAATACQSRAR